MKFNILISGVGGQGTIFASRVLSSYAMTLGFNVLSTDTVGAAQRGGSVTSHIRISDEEIYSPLIPKGRADVILGFESIEMLRHARLANKNTLYILNLHAVPTTFTMMGIDKYPTDEEIINAARRISSRGYIIRATEAAQKLGFPQSANAVMLGALAKAEPFFKKDLLKEKLREIAPRFSDVNLKAFDVGYGLI